jgi:protochlorophyllide reductase
MNTLMLLALLGLFLQVHSFALNNNKGSIIKSRINQKYEVPQMIFDNIFSTASSNKIPSNKKLCIITGTTSGLGKETLRSLLNKGNYYVICGCRDVDKMKEVAEREGFDPKSHTVIDLDLGSFQSTKDFAKKVKALKGSRPLEKLVCNAAVYQPAEMKPKWSSDNIEQQLQTNHLSHFLLCSLFIDDMKKAKDARMIIIGSITGNTNTVGGGVVLPFADLGNLEGMKEGSKNPIAMIDGKIFNGAKAYKDSKICNMMTVNELHKRYHKSTGITFASLYPGCIATTQLFREKRQWFRTLFPLFMRYVTGGFVSEEESGQRLAQVVDDENLKKSGIYWSWNGGARTVAYRDFSKPGAPLTGAGGSGGNAFENDPSDEVKNPIKAAKMWEYSTKITGAVWPKVSADALA